MKRLTILTIPFALSGCLWDTGSVTQTVNGITTTTASAIVARENSLNILKANRDNMQKEMYAMSGTDVDIQFDYIKYSFADGSFAVIPQLKKLRVTVKESPKFQQALPAFPKDHRIWSTVDAGIKAFLTGFGVYQLAKWGQNTNDNSGTRYNGPYSANSYNPTTTNTGIPLVQ